MAKVPAFQFYPADWIRDTQLQMASASSRGIWANLLCAMWFSPNRGRITGSKEELKKLGNCSQEEIEAFLCENSRHNFASVTEANKNITVENRRMVREEKVRKSSRLRQSRFRKRLKNRNVTSSSPSTPSTPSTAVTPSSPKHSEETDPQPPRSGFDQFWSRYPRKVAKKAAAKAWERLAPNNGLIEAILTSLMVQSGSEAWGREGGQFIPHPATWLNGRRWEDEVAPAAVHLPKATQQGLDALEGWRKLNRGPHD